MIDYHSPIILDNKYRDRHTGFVGTAVCVAFYLHGCERVTLKTMVNSAVVENTFDGPNLTPHSDGELGFGQ
jgi:hypothetical protein